MKRLFAWVPEEPMQWIIYGLILLSIAGVLAGNWVAFPLSKGWSAPKFSFLAYSPGNPHRSIASFGLLAALALLAGAEGYRRKRWILTYGAGTALLLVTFAGFLNLAFGQPALLKDLLNEAAWQQAGSTFAQSYLPPNPVSEASVLSSLAFDNIGWRIFSGWYFMGIGWYVGVAMALALMICGARGLAPRTARRAFGVTFLLLAGVACVFLLHPLMGEQDLVAAVRAEVHSDPAEARSWYEKAIHDDGWNALDLGVYRRIGLLDRALGQVNTPAYRIYRAEVMVLEQRLPEAIAQYETIADSNDAVGILAQNRASQLWVMHGLNLFDAGAYGSAAIAFEHALNYQPRMWIAAFYLARAYFAVGDYGKADALATRIVQLTKDPEFVSNLYSDAGDAKYRLGDLAGGHYDYSRSYYYDYVPNWRALTSLTGSVGN